MKSPQQFFIPIMLLTLFVSCNKHQEIPTTSIYKLINRNDQQITIDIYGNQADYGANTNRISRGTVLPNAYVSKTLEVGKTYWVDWYSDDYSLSNLYPNGKNEPLPKLDIAAVDDERIITAGQHDSVRSVMLAGSNVLSLWKGVDKYGVEHRFSFRKDFSGTHTFEQSGIMTSEDFSYRLNFLFVDPKTGRNTNFELTISGVHSSLAMEVWCGLINVYPLTGRDSLAMFGSSGNLPDYYIVRQ